jgi:hypothetical protein
LETRAVSSRTTVTEDETDPDVLAGSQAVKLAAILYHTTTELEEGLVRLGLNPRAYDLAVVEEQLLDLDLEQCANCGVWVSSRSLVDREGGLVDCRCCRRAQREQNLRLIAGAWYGKRRRKR